MNESSLKIRGFAISLHAKMAETAEVDKDGAIVWAGSVAKLFRELGISPGYHTPVMGLLSQTDCLRQVQKGTKGINSVYVLLRSPGTLTDAEWPSVNSIVKSARKGLTTETGGYKLLEQEIRNLAARLGPPDLNLAKALAELQSQINSLNHRITELELGNKA